MPQTTDTFRVLLVEDEVHLAAQVAGYLDAHGYVVRIESQLEDALRVLHEDAELDLVISDIYLDNNSQLGTGGNRPGGLIVAEACESRMPQLPVVLLTGRPSLDAALEGLRHHVFDLLTKPVELPALEQRARHAITACRLRRRVAELEEVNALLSHILPNAIEAKDPLTRGHSDRVAGYADSLGRRCGLDLEERRDLRLAAMLHDVGKIGVPEEILTKEGPLTRSERDEIEKHPGIGFKILAPLHHFPRVRDWVYQHHEHWNGRGYPEGLEGEEVALPGRILILAEVFDALATKRSYKAAWSREKIADFFDGNGGSHFDPEIAGLVADGVRSEGAAWFLHCNGGAGGSHGNGLGQNGQGHNGHQLPLF